MQSRQSDVFEDFSQWILSALPGVSAETVDLRQKAIVGAVAKASKFDPAVILDLVRILFSLPRKSLTAESYLKTVCQKKDPRFESSADSHEFQVLAGAMLAGLMRTDTVAGRAAALGILCVDMRGHRTAPYATPFVSLASECRRLFAIGDVQHEKWPTIPTLSDPEAAENVPVSADRSEKLLGYLGELSSQVERLILQQREELDITWWVLGQYSRDFNGPVSALTGVNAPVVLAKEFADLTKTVVGPVAANAVLDRMIAHTNAPQEIKLFEAVESLPKEWESEWLRTAVGQRSPDAIFPFFAAATRHVEVAGDLLWRDAYAKAIGLNASVGLAPLGLATQVYDECLLLRIVSATYRNGTESSQ